MKHECDKIPTYQPITIAFNKHGWNIQVEDYGDWTPIAYCPFCGTKLEELT